MFSNNTSYFYLGAGGLALGAAAVVGLGAATGASWLSIALCVVAPLVGWVVGIKIRHILEGEERLVLLEGFASAVGATALVLWIAGEPVAAGIDLVSIGIGAQLILGRLGCLTIGCCHGRPHAWGIRYGDRHAELGFPDYYVGVPLLPLQAFASAAQLGLTAGCALLQLTPHPDGSVIGFYFALYAPARFGSELFRGDPERGYALGLSYAQWLCLVIAWVVAALSPGFVPLQLGAAVVVTGMAAVALFFRRRIDLVSAAHVEELAETLDELDRTDEPLAIASTSRGLRLSRSRGHIALSMEQGELDPSTAAAIAAYVAVLARIDDPSLARIDDPSLEAGKTAGVYHLRWPASRQPTTDDR